MSKNIIWIIVLIAALIGFIFFLGTDEEPIDPQQIAQNWIVNNSPTYKFDGQDLAFLARGEKMYFAFQSTSAGYGDRTGQMSATVITPHIMEIIVENGEVVSAITDGKYNEITNEMIGEYLEENLEGDKEISVYFLNIESQEEELVEVKRTIPYEPGISIHFAAINQLLNGPTEDESERGIFSMINPGTVVYDLTIEDGVAIVDFNEKLQEGVAGSASVMAIRNQIERTLLQFDDINEVVISINGESEEILQP
jgi:Spore germination protein